MTEFKPGDKVVRTGGRAWGDHKTGPRTVDKVVGNQVWFVESGTWLSAVSLEHYKEPTMKYKPGDIVAKRNGDDFGAPDNRHGVVTVDHIDEAGSVWFKETDTWLDASELYLVERPELDEPDELSALKTRVAELEALNNALATALAEQAKRNTLDSLSMSVSEDVARIYAKFSYYYGVRNELVPAFTRLPADEQRKYIDEAKSWLNRHPELLHEKGDLDHE